MNATETLVTLMITGDFRINRPAMVELLRPAAGSMSDEAILAAINAQSEASVDLFPLTATNEEIARHAAAALLVCFPV